MGHLTLYLQTNGKEENHHEYVIDELLDGHLMREQPVYVTVGTLQVNLDIGLQK